ncbi:MAG TPA: PadR family transcriptional regulator [Actinomycetota bacterium]|nr:PadR family transcriptional regulator [Actinomycetota bacterium]
MKGEDRELTTISYVVLGLVASTPRCTTYDMKRIVQMSIGNFWAFPHTSLYAESARLVELGMLDVDQEETGRRRRVYSLTQSGREALTDWLHEPDARLPGIRYPALLKLYFSGLAPDASDGLAAAQVESLSERLFELKGMYDEYAGRPDVTAQLSTLRLGIGLVEAALAFWRSILETQPAGAAVSETGGSVDRGSARGVSDTTDMSVVSDVSDTSRAKVVNDARR